MADLPFWDNPPDDPAEAIVVIKRAIRDKITASGRTPEEVFGVIEALVHERSKEIRRANEAEGSAWPIVHYSEIEQGRVDPDLVSLVRRRGCLVVREHFSHSRARQWDREIVEYVESNGFFDAYRGSGDAFFTSVESLPAILPIYWSQPQMQARQSSEMAVVQAFLNGLWTHSGSPSEARFDPRRNVLYPDRIRRRPEGTTSKGLGYHIDAGTLDLWLKPAYQQAFRHVFDGSIENFDPWDAAHRIDGTQFPGTTMTSVFRTFQGWTALSDMDHDQGVLHSIPIPEAIAYLLLRPLLSDVAEDDMCGVAISRMFSVTEKWHAPLLDAVSGIPDVRAGDSVWWHGDMVHGVAPVAEQRGWGNVMYIPAAPWCPRNERYASSLAESLRAGSSPSDFPEEHYEEQWSDRFMIDDLNENGRQSLSL